MKYIDADKLIAEIERRIELLENGTGNPEVMKRVEGVLKGYNSILSFIDSLQQEQPEVDLSEETITKEFHIIENKCFNEGIVGWQKEKLIARHFYELGLNTKNKK